MKRLLSCVALVAMGLALPGMSHGASPLKENPVSTSEGSSWLGLDQVAKKGKKPVKQQKIDGHKLLSKKRMTKLKNGRHLLHTHAKTGHKAFVHLKNGKVAGLTVKDRRGKAVRVRKGKPPRRGGKKALVFAGPNDQLSAFLNEPASGSEQLAYGWGGYGSGTVCYYYYNIQIRVYVIYCFPPSSCCNSSDYGNSGSGGYGNDGGDDYGNGNGDDSYSGSGYDQ